MYEISYVKMKKEFCGILLELLVGNFFPPSSYTKFEHW